MSCPTCDHTMERLTVGYFLCPRCGTVRVVGQGTEAGVTLAVVVPQLVDRCRDFEALTITNGCLSHQAQDERVVLWEGIAESIHPRGEKT